MTRGRFGGSSLNSMKNNGAHFSRDKTWIATANPDYVDGLKIVEKQKEKFTKDRRINRIIQILQDEKKSAGRVFSKIPDKYSQHQAVKQYHKQKM